MITFTTRIELIGGTEKDYLRLSDEMQKKSFKQSQHSSTTTLAKSKNDSPRIFNSNSPKDLLSATKVVSQAAANTGKKYSFTVMRDKEWRHS